MIDSMEIILSPEYDYNTDIQNREQPYIFDEQFEKLYTLIGTHAELEPSLAKVIDNRTYIPRAYTNFKDEGIILQPLDKTHQIKATVFLYRVIDSTDRVSLYEPTDIETFISCFNGIMDKINAPHIDSKRWKVSRIDYAVNFQTEYKQLYLHLMNKSRTRHKQIRGRFETSCYLMGKGYTYNTYDKAEQLRAKQQSGHNRQIISDNDIDKAEKILRFEVQCKRGKVNTLAKRFKWKDRDVMNFLKPFVAFYVLTDCANHFFKGDYLTANREAKNNIYAAIEQNAKGTKRIKDGMTQIAKSLASEPDTNIDDIKERLKQSGYNRDDINYLFRRFNELNINPVPISIRLSKKYRLQQLKSIPHLLADYIENTDIQKINDRTNNP